MSPDAAPAPRSIANGLLHRLLEHPVTTLSGLGVGGAIYYALNSWHCQVPEGSVDWIKWGATAGPVILGMLAKDK